MSDFVEVSIPRQLLADLLTLYTTNITKDNTDFIKERRKSVASDIALSALGSYTDEHGDESNEANI